MTPRAQRVVIVLGAAAACVLLVAGLLLVLRWREVEERKLSPEADALTQFGSLQMKLALPILKEAESAMRDRLAAMPPLDSLAALNEAMRAAQHEVGDRLKERWSEEKTSAQLEKAFADFVQSKEGQAYVRSLPRGPSSVTTTTRIQR